MFYRYEIINDGYEDILYLYLTMKYEFSKELISSYDLNRRMTNFINMNNINFKGRKIYLVADGIIVKKVDINKKEIANKDSLYSCDSFLVNIKTIENSFYEVKLREYLTSILFKYYSYNLNDEVLKAIAVLYNTYAYKMMSENNYIDNNYSFTEYTPIDEYRITYNDYEDILLKINSIINEIDCYFLKYNNEYILPFIHYSSIGKTLTNDNYPYLSSVKSVWDFASPYYISIEDFSYSQLSKLFNIKIDNSFTIKKENKNIKFGSKPISYEELQKCLNLKSTYMYIISYNNHLRFITKGWGSSYGLSLFGANELANNGVKFFDILKYYFPKTKLYKYIKELS